MKYYKVVTCDMMSLGLRKNPNIFKYNLHIWKNEPNPQKNKNDNGGIWCCKKLSSARALKKYYKRYGIARIFNCVIGNILYQNSYRTKTNKVKLLNEIL